MSQPIVKTGYVILDLRTTDVIVDRVFLEEDEAKKYMERHPDHEMVPTPVIIEQNPKDPLYSS